MFEWVLILILFLFVPLVFYEFFRNGVLLIFGGLVLLVEIDGFEEGLCGDNPQHGQGGGGAYYGIGEESASVSAGARLDERGGASDASEAQTDVGF